MDKWVKRENEPLISRLISIGMLLKKLYIFMSRSYCKLQKLQPANRVLLLQFLIIATTCFLDVTIWKELGQRVHGGTLGHANLIAGLYRISGGKRRFNVSKKEFLLLWNAIVFYQFLNAVIAVLKVFFNQDGILHRIFIYIIQLSFIACPLHDLKN